MRSWWCWTLTVYHPRLPPCIPRMTCRIRVKATDNGVFKLFCEALTSQIIAIRLSWILWILEQWISWNVRLFSFGSSLRVTTIRLSQRRPWGACVSDWMGLVSSRQRRSFPTNFKYLNYPMKALKSQFLRHITLNDEWRVLVISVARRRCMPHISIWDAIEADLLMSAA